MEKLYRNKEVNDVSFIKKRTICRWKPVKESWRCNSLVVADNGEITDFKMRCEKSKYTTVKALQSIGYDTIASGDSHNDLGMIQASKAGFLFKSTDAIKSEYPEIPAYETYDELYDAIRKVIKG